MRYLETNSTNPFYNLAFEEYVLTHCFDDNYLILWQNDNTIVVGQNQNTVAEINADFVKDHNINVVRRTTGGGAVYHDMGNLNYSFIADGGEIDKLSFERFTRPIVDCLTKLGLDAKASGRNDILVSEKKVSGTAQRVYKGRVLHHGTLLFDANPAFIAGALNANEVKFRGKASKSVRARIGNIRDFLPDDKDMDMQEFWQYLKNTLLSENSEDTPLTPEDLDSINKLYEEKYNTWEWNYGRSPKYETTKTSAFDGGIIEVRYTVDSGNISDIRFFGDFLSRCPLDPVISVLTGCKLNEESLTSALKSLDNFTDYFGGITVEEVVLAII